MKIAVYGISLNEDRHVDRFMRSCEEADGVYISDTGSTDGTVEMLRERGAEVNCITVDPFRFDVARNLSLDFVPKDVDVCISLDLDEVLVPGWRKIVEDNWEPGVTKIVYPMVNDWEDEAQTRPHSTIWGYKVHSRHGYVWKYPVHVIPVAIEDNWERVKLVHGEIVRHYQDTSRKERKGRIAIYERHMDEYKDDHRMCYYYARELMNLQRFEEAEEWALRSLSLIPQYPEMCSSDGTLAVVRATTCRFIAGCKSGRNRPADEILVWIMRSLSEAPWSREPWMHMGRFWLSAKDWAAAESAFRRGHMIKAREASTNVIEEWCWDGRAESMWEEAKRELAKEQSQETVRKLDAQPCSAGAGDVLTSSSWKKEE